MLDNKQRAHDLALVAVQDVLKKSQYQTPDDKGEVRVDIYNEYVNAYEIALNAFERDFKD